MRIFLAAPISGFENENEYLTYRKKVVELIDGLKKSFVVMSELDKRLYRVGLCICNEEAFFNYSASERFTVHGTWLEQQKRSVFDYIS